MIQAPAEGWMHELEKKNIFYRLVLFLQRVRLSHTRRDQSFLSVHADQRRQPAVVDRQGSALL
jgi:hypothetical protein